MEEMSMEFLKILKKYCECFFYPMKISILKAGSLINIPNRINEYSQRYQYHAGQILKNLQPKLPADAFCMIAVCLTDLYPRDEWNFVFGLASIKDRTGVFSFARYD
jgi:archaemetzincin